MTLARALLLGTLLFPLSVVTVKAQDADYLYLHVSGHSVATNGAETPVSTGAFASTREMGKPMTTVFSMVGCGVLSVRRAPASFDDAAVAGWRVELTPLRKVGDAVTFRLRWTRALDPGGAPSPPSEDSEITLRAGESRPLDSVPVATPTALSADRRTCSTKSLSLRVTAQYPESDRRLVGVDVWLVERLANGAERSQLQSIRGTPHQPILFFFDRIADRNLDVFGNIRGESVQGGVELALEAMGAHFDTGQETGYQAIRWTRATLRLKPDETVEVPLPRDVPSVYGNGNFALRIRARQLR